MMSLSTVTISLPFFASFSVLGEGGGGVFSFGFGNLDFCFGDLFLRSSDGGRGFRVTFRGHAFASVEFWRFGRAMLDRLLGRRHCNIEFGRLRSNRGI